MPTAQDTLQQWLDALGLSGDAADSQREIRIRIGAEQLEAVLNDTAEARQFAALLPLTITATNYGGREVYGGMDGSITVWGAGQLHFENGDITYCPSNQTAAIFYAQTDRPQLTMAVYPIGRITSSLAAFNGLDSPVDITFEWMEETP